MVRLCFAAALLSIAMKLESSARAAIGKRGNENETIVIEIPKKGVNNSAIDNQINVLAEAIVDNKKKAAEAEEKGQPGLARNIDKLNEGPLVTQLGQLVELKREMNGTRLIRTTKGKT
ncbi:hypothetical protein CDD80_2946 [Ophiocordyceps camponoti-rufipedis]|uniref:Uncharacterized protein n=1 Tax=Ophiocordyceps camponoti-rufipedis TaxID=2004952 RepID=A0A2C5Z630_9HYPO|nr:hypothetical protein CDD80_2946 [Ophiocordyceps camponoti-rufipedis]